MRCAAKAAEKEASRANAAALDDVQSLSADDAPSAAPATLPAGLLAAIARGISPCANDDGPQVELICSGESGGELDSKKTPGSPEFIEAPD
uniref:Uncharacterized protein n=1 Tax=Peronospora matthiolae TaxID=2874970 RepID=A0AAV1TA90_9STRA